MDVARLFFGGAVSVFMVGSLASFGGLDDAATSTKHSLIAVKTALTRSSPRKDTLGTNTPAADQYTAKVTICHNGHTIEINESALRAHLRNGDAIDHARKLRVCKPHASAMQHCPPASLQGTHSHAPACPSERPRWSRCC